MAKQKEIKFRERGNVLEGRRGNLTFALYSDISQTAPDKGTYSVVVRHKDIERRFFPKGTNFDSLIYLLQSGCEFIRNNSKVRFAKEAQYRVDKPDYAERAVTEAVVNALIHRDYIVLGSGIHIDMYDDRVEIVSPGGMFEGAPVQECDINTIRSVHRNPVIADLFHRMKYMERRGSGLRKIVSETEKLPGYEEYLKPEFFSTPSDFRVILKNVNYTMSGSSIEKPHMIPYMTLSS